MKYLLDTHVWVWWHMQPQKLSKRIRTILLDPQQYDELLLSAISPWEFSKLLEKKRIGISCNPEEWIREALAMPKLRLIHITPTISYRSTTLPQPFHDDPADQIIVASAREENATVITKDSLIRGYHHVRTLW
ncbi:MAG: twitching motility protein PilT [Nitrospirales bacterium]|nr:MAG: twitching motility protein PilT [Nitrospirales bacterium]